MTPSERDRDRTGPGGSEASCLNVRRRRFVGASVGALAMGLAGCSSVTTQEFAASQVRLPEAVQEALLLPESFTETETQTFEQTVADQDVEVTISSAFAGYERRAGGPGTVWDPVDLTLVERFLGIGRAATPGSGSGINAVASDLRFGQSNPAYVEGDATVDPEQVTVVVPEWARHDGDEVRLDDLLALQHAEALGVAELTSRGTNNYLVPAQDVIPPTGFSPDAGWSTWTPDERWVAGHGSHWIPDDPTRLQCVVCLGEQSPADVFGVDELPGRRLDDGETVDTADTLVFLPAPKEFPTADDVLTPPSDFDGDGWPFDVGIPAPVRGPTYGMGVMATPNAEVNGESVNPLARIGLGDLLTSDVARDFLARFGLTDADEVEWLRGPERATSIVTWSETGTTSLLEESVAVESFVGVVNGRAGPWAVAVHAAKATPGDVVFAAATHRRPIGTPDGPELVGEAAGVIDDRWATRALELTAESFGSLQVVEDG